MKLKISILCTIFFTPLFSVFAQGPIEITPTTEGFSMQVAVIYGALLWIFGLLANKIPGLSKIKPGLSVLAAAIGVGIYLWYFGWSDIKDILISYFLTTKILYEGMTKGELGVKSGNFYSYLADPEPEPVPELNKKGYIYGPGV